MELGGFEPPTSWVRSGELWEAELDDLQGLIGHWLARAKPRIPADSGRYPAFRPLVGLEWLKFGTAELGVTPGFPFDRSRLSP